MADLTSLAGSINKMSTSLAQLGIDMTALQVTAGAFQLIGGSAKIIQGLIAAKTAYNNIRMAEGVAHLAKYGPYAAVIAPLAIAGGAAIGMAIEQAISTTDDGAGMRALAGGWTNGRD